MKAKNIIAIALFALLMFGIWKLVGWREGELVRSHGGTPLPDISDKRTPVQLLEARIKKLEADVKDLREINDEITTALKAANGYMSNNTALAYILASEIEEHISNTNIHRVVPSVIVTGAQRTVAPNIQPQTKRGVPIAIYNQIASEAAKDWPKNFSMQEFEINRQIEAYLKLKR